jgi:hypothetical protein
MSVRRSRSSRSIPTTRTARRSRPHYRERGSAAIPSNLLRGASTALDTVRRGRQREARALCLAKPAESPCSRPSGAAPRAPAPALPDGRGSRRRSRGPPCRLQARCGLRAALLALHDLFFKSLLDLAPKFRGKADGTGRGYATTSPAETRAELAARPSRYFLAASKYGLVPLAWSVTSTTRVISGTAPMMATSIPCVRVTGAMAQP